MSSRVRRWALFALDLACLVRAITPKRKGVKPEPVARKVAFAPQVLKRAVPRIAEMRLAR